VSSWEFSFARWFDCEKSASCMYIVIYVPNNRPNDVTSQRKHRISYAFCCSLNSVHNDTYAQVGNE